MLTDIEITKIDGLLLGEFISNAQGEQVANFLHNGTLYIERDGR